MTPRLMLALALSTSACAALAADIDERSTLVLTPAERAFVATEMRGFLSGIQEVTTAIAKNDMKAVAAAARPMGMVNARHAPPSLRQKFPLEFKELGRATHIAFDDLARDAESMGDANLALTRLGEALTNCASCHAMYRVSVQP